MTIENKNPSSNTTAISKNNKNYTSNDSDEAYGSDYEH